MLLRHAEFGRQFHSSGFRHLHGDLLQEIEALIRKRVGPPTHFVLDIVLMRGLAQFKPDLSEFLDFGGYKP